MVSKESFCLLPVNICFPVNITQEMVVVNFTRRDFTASALQTTANRNCQNFRNNIFVQQKIENGVEEQLVTMFGGKPVSACVLTAPMLLAASSLLARRGQHKWHQIPKFHQFLIMGSGKFSEFSRLFRPSKCDVCEKLDDKDKSVINHLNDCDTIWSSTETVLFLLPQTSAFLL